VLANVSTYCIVYLCPLGLGTVSLGLVLASGSYCLSRG